MSPARWVRGRPGEDRLLLVDVRTASRVDARVRDLPTLLRRSDLVVLNDAATLPASLDARVGGVPFELRLASRLVNGRAWAVAFGAGDWRTATEARAWPPPLPVGATVELDGTAVTARVTDSVHGRLVHLQWHADEAAVLAAVYDRGRPIQYAHVDRDLPLWAVQTPFATRPWAVEMPSAGRSVGASVLAGLRKAGIDVARLTHAAGLSSTGDPRLDALLPLAEDYEIPVATVRAVAAAHARGGRVIAVGTTVTRALESAAATGSLVAGPGTATLTLHAGYRRRVVDGVVTGFHEEGSSHLRLLASFAPEGVLADAYAHAEREGYLCHELGDVSLIVAA